MDCFCTKKYLCLSCERLATESAKRSSTATKKPTSNRKAAQCGTRAGYNKHIRLREQTCAECRAAQTKSVNNWQKENRKALV